MYIIINMLCNIWLKFKSINRKYVTILSIWIFIYVRICTLERSVFCYTEAVVLRCTVKNILKNFANSQKNTCVGVSLLKRESRTVVFL